MTFGRFISSIGIMALTCWGMTPVFGQETVQVVTKKIDKTFGFDEGYELNIEGERAEVYIEASEGPGIVVQLELIARHPDEAVARRDLDHMQYLVRRVKNKIYLRNYLKVPEDAPKPESQIRAIYRIQVPPNCPVYTKNTYGLVEASSLTKSLRVNSQFSKIGLTNVAGMIDLQTRYGDIVGERLDGNISIMANRSDILLRDMRGSYDINAKYGVIDLFASEGLLDLKLEADKSEVYLHNVNLQAFSYELSAKNGRIEYPDQGPFVLEEPETGLQRVRFKPSSEFYPNISVKITFGNIHLTKN
jgi:hypothetical protein